MRLSRREIVTIPNLLSLLRVLMIPVFVGLYLNGHYPLTAAMLLISGITDVADGYIARRYRMISEFGMIFDPVADKLTQAAMLLCLTVHHPSMLLPLVMLFVKECFSGISGYIAMRRTGKVNGAAWHGKAATLLLYGMMILHVMWQDIPAWLSNTLNVGCVAMMVISLVLYVHRNMKIIRAMSGK